MRMDGLNEGARIGESSKARYKIDMLYVRGNRSNTLEISSKLLFVWCET